MSDLRLLHALKLTHPLQIELITNAKAGLPYAGFPWYSKILLYRTSRDWR